jgi:hypothetical protein
MFSLKKSSPSQISGILAHFFHLGSNQIYCANHLAGKLFVTAILILFELL